MVALIRASIATLLITAALRFMNPAGCQAVSVLAHQSNVVKKVGEQTGPKISLLPCVGWAIR
jgi:hypothetical protein